MNSIHGNKKSLNYFKNHLVVQYRQANISHNYPFNRTHRASYLEYIGGVAVGRSDVDAS